MDKKSKIFFIVFFLLITSSVLVTYYRFMVQHDYIIQAEADCDPYTESCFVYVCDPEAGEECTGDPVEDTSYYKLIDRNAKNIPSCDPADETCTALVCPEGEADCSYTLCDPATANDGEVCNDPVVYTAENPLEEEEATDEEEVTGEEDTAMGDETATDGETTDGSVSDSGTATGDETSADSVTSDGGTAPTRNALVLLNETSCSAGKAFVFVTTVKVPVDTDGNYETRFSSTKAQVISLIDATGQVCAKSVSLPIDAGKVYINAKSTAVASVFQAKDIFTTTPKEAQLRLTMIEASPSFPTFLAYVTAKLPTTNVTTLTADPEFQNLVKKCTEEVTSKLLP
ncbi:MAG: hypothetical protein GW815_02300 [Candidatus Moranbacteria bacterium]|nr:hypothetical protein [Candidatus Moranbacteria bacterium]OIQ03497.1 MAG: hypothetical protein AUK58_01780 [Candidatus Moranbacteria bacterium CG2_30_41_165]PIP25302.1 MAG: hypothetical protein COX32_04420 [Candidatus Moranbacteria bacterium CG23_combo_of_CG06-09_8_20_14_all_41_28]PIV86586.1 MAG: hypothetical protein COW50_00705 [Candidatus Moranbacteria bacterium CG17_big_fil_post_rev_8_21_14_2_50_41_107]PIW93822.1 MAG: hypothetical protein COZ86_04360 [Candidatus Moranbacteria bacterium CG_